MADPTYRFRLGCELEPGRSIGNLESLLGKLLLASLSSGYAVSMHARKPPGVITDYGLEWFRGKLHNVDTLYRDRLGVTAYREIGSTQFAALGNPGLLTASTFTTLVDQIDAAGSANLSRRNMISYELYASSRFESSSRARFLLLVMSIESLTEQAPRTTEEQRLLDQVLSLISADTNVSADGKSALGGAIRMLRNNSIGFSCRKLIEDAYAAGAVSDSAAARHFSECYRIRGKIVHSGVTPSPDQLTTESNRLEPTIRQLISWRLRSCQANQDEFWSSDFAEVLEGS